SPSIREPLVLGAGERAGTYSMEVLAQRYLDLYEQTVRETRAESRRDAGRETTVGPNTILVQQ
ncbi:MAG: hypothetical protein OER95_08480, partial [Acidimicrobiia bacterium]|nr:hypothetical protein [Acidimicrobiia bacterium]